MTPRHRRYPKSALHRRAKHPAHTVALAGRIVETPGGLGLAAGDEIVPLSPKVELEPGQIVELLGTSGPQGVAADQVHVLVEAGDPNARDARRIRATRARAEMNRTIRDFFHSRDFVEVETPNLVPSAGTDVYLEAFQTRFSGFGAAAAATLFLHTSPEFFMKELLVGGMERIFQICKAYRNGELTAAHNPEFTILEWYRAFADFVAIMDDVEALVRAVLGRDALDVGGASVDLVGPFDRKTVAEVFAAHCGLDILELDDEPSLRAAADEAGLGPFSPHSGWADIFHQLLVTHVEPRLGRQRPIFLTHYPRELAVLSRACDDDPRVAERFELYIAGVELCNGFTELNDPVEQSARFAADLQERARLGLAAYPMPERFIAALEAGMPPAAGVAVGLDRLLMLALGSDDIGDVLMRAV